MTDDKMTYIIYIRRDKKDKEKKVTFRVFSKYIVKRENKNK